MTLGGRFSLVLCGIAMLSTCIALVPQELALARDLENVARGRLERSSASAAQLLENHLDVLAERYRSISLTPEFRANLEAGHTSTLAYFASHLAREHGASLVAFTDRHGQVSAASGDLVLPQEASQLLDSWAEEPPKQVRSLLAEVDGAPFASTIVPLRTNQQVVGGLIAIEAIGLEAIRSWSQLCGAQIHFRRAGSQPSAELALPVWRLGELTMMVEGNLDAERAALASARNKLLTGGAAALALAFAISLVLARGLIRPIRVIQEATEPIGLGDFSVRLPVDRADELGDVSRAIQRMASRLETSRARLLNAQRLARLGHWSIDTQTRTLQASEQVMGIFGLGDQDEPLTDAHLVARVHPDDRQRFQSALELCLTEEVPFQLDHRTIDAQGRERFTHTRSNPGASTADPGQVEGTVQDITERKRVEEQIRYLADYDSLTGLANRRLFREKLGRAISEAVRSESQLWLLFIDLDGFKLVNDTFGHSAGDEVLQIAARRLSEAAAHLEEHELQLGSSPVVAMARSGGDEFTLLLAGIHVPGAAGRVAQSLLAALAQPIDLGAHQVAVSASIGIAAFPEDGDDAETLLRNGDTAMHHAKAQGRNGYQFYSESMNAMVSRRLMLENKLRRALDEEDLSLHYQPKVSLTTHRVTGFEALLRWHDPDLGNVSPADFIPVAEEGGLIVPIGNWVLRAAVEQIRRWQDTELAGLPVSINLSGNELRESMVDRVGNAIEEGGIEARLLQIEITETAVMRGDASAISALEQLREIGVHIALDDFGTGYSSLSYIRTLPIDTLKIDQSFVRFVETDATDAALLGSIVSMAQILELHVTAEGVETEGQLALLQELGCDEVQGYLLGVPMRPEDTPRCAAEINQRLRAKSLPSRDADD